MERNASRVRSMKSDEEKPSKSMNGLKQPNLGRSTELNEKNNSPAPFHNIIIPSYKAARCQIKQEQPIAVEHTFTSSLDKYENSRIGETLKDIIMKTITEKVRCKSQSDLFPLTSQINLDHKKSSNLSSAASPLKQIKREDSDRKRGSTSDPASSPAKKTRPKRGQYRKYNSQLLMEAVKAVQRGEMSVHRAGSYYGVPHSTLEYKVKERHLLRQKKIKEQQQQQKEAGILSGSSSKRTSSAASSSSSTTSDGTGRSSSGGKSANSSKGESSKKSEKTVKTDPNCPAWYSPYLSGGTHFDAAPGLGFYNTSGFALNTPASELLRKLQHKVQSKSDSFTEEPAYKVLGSSNVGALGEGFLFIN